MRVKNCSRSLDPETEKGTPPSERVVEKLPNLEWDLVLDPVPGESRRLEGYHGYRVATVLYSEAKEVYTYHGV